MTAQYGETVKLEGAS